MTNSNDSDKQELIFINFKCKDKKVFAKTSSAFNYSVLSEMWSVPLLLLLLAVHYSSQNENLLEISSISNVSY